MNWFRKLPGAQRSPYGLERRVLRQIPRMALTASSYTHTALAPMLRAARALELLQRPGKYRQA